LKRAISEIASTGYHAIQSRSTAFNRGIQENPAVERQELEDFEKGLVMDTDAGRARDGYEMKAQRPVGRCFQCIPVGRAGPLNAARTGERVVK
jgi:hypothetical protein